MSTTTQPTPRSPDGAILPPDVRDVCDAICLGLTALSSGMQQLSEHMKQLSASTAKLREAIAKTLTQAQQIVGAEAEPTQQVPLPRSIEALSFAQICALSQLFHTTFGIVAGDDITACRVKVWSALNGPATRPLNARL